MHTAKKEENSYFLLIIINNKYNVLYLVLSMNCYTRKLRGNEVSGSKILDQMNCGYKRLLFINFIT
jgi:hypothetical protein